ncbi:MAG: phosphate acyltransferase [Elusimicrobiales bacterium]
MTPTVKFTSFSELLASVKGKCSRAAVPGANNAEAMEAVKAAYENGLLSSGALIGEEAAVHATAAAAGLNLSDFEIINCSDPQKMCAGAVSLITSGKADFLIKGLVDTKCYMQAILSREAGLVPEGGVLNHFVLFETPRYKKPFAVTDSAIFISPTIEQKMRIIDNAAQAMRRLGVERPKVSLVCPVEKVNPKIKSTTDAAEIVRRANAGGIKDAAVEGPYDVYITFSRKLAEEKGVAGGEVPGDVDIAVFDDLDAANAVYKTLSLFGEGVSAAAIVVGAKVPVVLPSRTDSPSTKLNSIALASFLKEHR